MAKRHGRKLVADAIDLMCGHCGRVVLSKADFAAIQDMGGIPARMGAGFLARRGELDLVCRKGDDLVVVEVKTRQNDTFGTPIEAVGARKRRALMAAAAEYRALAGWRGPIRYAVVGLMVNREGGFDTELIEDPFD